DPRSARPRRGHPLLARGSGPRALARRAGRARRARALLEGGHGRQDDRRLRGAHGGWAPPFTLSEGTRTPVHPERGDSGPPPPFTLSEVTRDHPPVHPE